MSKTEQKQLVLVDGSSYLFRAFHALPPLSNSAGMPTGAVYGVLNMLRRLLQDYPADYVAVVFDAPGKTFRDEMYAEYKANRAPTPDDLRVQIEPLHTIVKAMGLPLLAIKGVEADDVIGTLARQAAAQGVRVIISTIDKDFAQLVNDKITMVNTMSNSVLDPQGVIDKFGVPPEKIIDFLALMGDSIDNIPGVEKVGPKTAAKWLNAYGSLEDVMAHADEIKGKVGENLRAAVGHLPLSKDLVTIRGDMELERQAQDLAPGEPDTATLRELYTRLEFRNWLKDLDESGPADAPSAPAAATDVTFETILTEAELKAWLKRLDAADLFVIAVEPTSANYMQAAVAGVAFAVEAGEAAYLPLGHDYDGAPKQLDRDKTLKALQPLLVDVNKPKLGHNLKLARNVLLNHDIEVRGIAHDTMLESYVLNSTASKHDLVGLCERHLQRRTARYEDVAGKGAKQLAFNEVSTEDATAFAADSADVTLNLHRQLWPQLERAEAQRRLYEEIEMPLLSVLSNIERNGVLVDSDMLFAQSHELTERMSALERDAHKAAGREFNLGSPKQIQEILYDELGLPVLRKTPKGQPSTAEDVLQELADDYDLPRLILDHRALSKLKSTYTDKLPEQIDPGTGRVHTSYHQAVASTGRLSSNDPNLQNIPVRTEEGRRVRRAFIAAQGKRILAVDYSQIELRIMAHLSGDEGLLKAFADGKDIHRATSAEVFGISLEEVTADQRRAAKAINFGLIYGMSAFGLARQLGIERGAAQDYVNLYFARYPRVKAYMDSTREQARKQGYVETLYGRRLYLPEINARNAQRRQYAERTAINAPMQGSAADIIKRAMIAVDRWLGESAAPVTMIMQVHDELVFEVDEDAVAQACESVSQLMINAGELSIPVVVAAGDGANWEEAH